MGIISAYANIAKYICLDSKIIHVGWRVVPSKGVIQWEDTGAKMHIAVPWNGYRGSQVGLGVLLFSCIALMRQC